MQNYGYRAHNASQRKESSLSIGEYGKSAKPVLGGLKMVKRIKWQNRLGAKNGKMGGMVKPLGAIKWGHGKTFRALKR